MPAQESQPSTVVHKTHPIDWSKGVTLKDAIKIVDGRLMAMKEQMEASDAAHDERHTQAMDANAKTNKRAGALIILTFIILLFVAGIFALLADKIFPSVM